jgi:hypothetical protein
VLGAVLFYRNKKHSQYFPHVFEAGHLCEVSSVNYALKEQKRELFSLRHNVQTGFGVHKASYPTGSGGIFATVNAAAA